jgi:hypothetical protein
MIQESLSSAIEYAQGMLRSNHSDAEILAGLTARGLEPAQAAELLEDLRHDQTSRHQEAEGHGGHASSHHGRRRRVRSHRHHSHESHHRPSYHGRKYKTRRTPWYFIPLAIIFVVAFVYAMIEIGVDRTDAVSKSTAGPPSRLNK